LGACRSARRMSPPGGASLDGEPPASAIVAARTAGERCFRPVPSRAVARGPGGVAIADSSARRLPVSTLFASSRACDIASDVLCRGVPRTERRLSTPPSPLRFPPPRPASAAASSKAAPFFGPGRLPSSECSLPLSRRTLSRLHVGSRGARHRSRCSRAGGFRRRDPASGACSRAAPSPSGGRPTR